MPVYFTLYLGTGTSSRIHSNNLHFATMPEETVVETAYPGDIPYCLLLQATSLCSARTRNQPPSGPLRPPWAPGPPDLSDSGSPLVTKVMFTRNHGETIKHQSEPDPQIQASQAVASEIIRTLSHVSQEYI